MTQSFLPAQAKVGTPLTYTVSVTNTGASTATAPTFTDALPDGVNFVSAVSSSGTCGLSGTVVGGNAAVMTSAVTTSVDDWRNLHFTAQELGNPNISGLTADAEGDGVPNLIEYALNLDPGASDVSALPAAATVSDATGTYFGLSYTIPPGVTDLTYTVEASSNLANWSNAGLQTVDEVNNPDGSRTVTVRDTTPLNQTFRKFMRLKVIKP